MDEAKLTIVHKTNVVKYKEIKVDALTSQAMIPNLIQGLPPEDYHRNSKQIWDPYALSESEVTTYLEKAFYFFDLYLGNQQDYNLQKLRRNIQQLRLHLEEAFLRVLQISGYDTVKSLLAVASG